METMTREVSGTSVIQHVENVKTPDDVAVNSCMRHVSIQTGEEFSAEFLRERKPRLETQTSEESFQACHQDRNKPSKTVVTSADLPQEFHKNCPVEYLRDHGSPTKTPAGVPYNQNQQFVYKDASGSGISKKDLKYGIDLSNTYQHKDHTSKGYHQHQQQQSVYTNEIYNDQAGFCPTSSSHHKSNSPQAYLQYGYVTGKLKFLCSFGGKILPRPSDGKLRYVGGETRIISIRKNINYQELMKKTSAICNHPHTIKYQLPDEDLDALISVCSDEDFHHMIEEYHELEKGSKRLRIFLVSLIEPENTSSYDSMPVQQTGNDYNYVVAVNGITEPSLSKSSSKENLEGGAMDFNSNFQQNSPLMDNGGTSSNSMKTLRNPTQFIQTPSKLMISNIQTTSSHMPVQLTDSTNPQMIACREQTDLNKQYNLLDEDMIKWTDTNNPNLVFKENQFANKHSVSRTASSDRFSNLSSRLQHNAENSVLLTTSGESDCVLRSNLNKNYPCASDSEIPFSALFTPNSSDFSVVESSEDNLSLTLDDKNSDDIPEIPVLVEDITDNLPFDVPSYRKVVPYVQEEPSYGVFTSSDMEAGSVAQSDNEDVEDGNRVKDELISGATIAQMEAGIYGVQIIKNADLEELRELGSGTFGTVYHGKWRGTDVAIKRIRKSCFAGKSSEQERLTKDFWREARILSKLHHPNVVALYGVVPDGPGGTLSTVTEYMANGSLRHVLSRNNRALDWRKKLMIAQDAAIGMEYLHLKNIVHFDLKCENLLVNLGDPQRPVCKVGDFGLSRIKRNTFVSGGVRGTLPWMAPELLYGGNNRVSEKVDVFSFGIAMWEILTEEEPYADMHCGAIIGGILSNTLRPPIPTRCDSRWKALMEECWSHDQADRPSFTQIMNKLQVMSMSLHSKTQNA